MAITHQIGTADGIRTHDLQSRSLALYPAELQPHNAWYYSKLFQKSKVLFSGIVNLLLLCYNSIMKTLLNKTGYLIFSLLLLLPFSACTAETEPSYDAGRYILSGVLLDGEELSPSALYPEGAYLLLSSDGTGRLILGSDASDITWQQKNASFSVAVNTLTASGTREGDSLSLSLDALHLELLFTEGDITSAVTESASASNLPSQTRQQLIWSGDWSGRLWFEDPKGEWADYRDRTLTVTCSVRVQPDGTGILRLYSPYYSDSVPMASASFSLEEYKVHCLSGYMMSYPIPEWGMDISLNTEKLTDVEDTVIFHPDIYEFGHFYNAETPVDRNAKTDVLRLTGSCNDLSGGFDYKIVLTKQTSH